MYTSWQQVASVFDLNSYVVTHKGLHVVLLHPESKGTYYDIYIYISYIWGGKSKNVMYGDLFCCDF